MSLLTKQQVADFFQVTTATITNWVEAGVIPEPIRMGATVRWSKEVIDEFVNKTGGQNGNSNNT